MIFILQILLILTKYELRNEITQNNEDEGEYEELSESNDEISQDLENPQ
jgi:hypothetical protein